MRNPFAKRTHQSRCRNSNSSSNNSSTPLFRWKRNKDRPDGNASTVGCSDNNPLVQNTITSKTECLHHSSPLTDLPRGLQGGGGQDVKVETLAEVLRVNQDSVVSYHSESQPGVNSQQTLEQTVVLLIQASVHKHLPEPPADLESDLKTHLAAVQKVVVEELLRLAPELEPHGLMGKLTEIYHRGVFKQMNSLLQQVTSTRNCLQLLHWVLLTYPSQDLLLDPEIQASDLVKHIDLVLLTDWTSQAQDKLLSFVQRDVSSHLNEIQKIDRKTCLTEEDYLGFHIDLIKCIDAAPSQAQKLSSELSLKLTKVCLKELLTFVTSHKSYRFEVLTKDKMADSALVSIFKDLKTCKELKSHVTQTKFKVSEVTSTVEEIVASLEEIEKFNLKCLLEIVTDFSESNLKKYFRSSQKDCFLMTDLKILFTPEPWLSLEEHKRAMDEAYKLFVRLYCKHLISHKLSELREHWSPDVANSIAEDAELIHNIMLDLCPGVEQWNFLLCHISDLLKTSDVDAMKVSTGALLQECINKRCADDSSLLYPLLWWMGWSRLNIREIVSALELSIDLDHVFPKPWYCLCFG